MTLKRLTILLISIWVLGCLCTGAAAKPKNQKVTIKVGSYNLMTSDSRVKHIDKTP